MIHLFIGNLGHLFVILSFVTSLMATYAYFKASNASIEELPSRIRFARILFYLHAFSVLGIIVSLFSIISNHYYEYHYAWNHSSNTLPIHYMISSFWEGQEGSFLLWIFWHSVLGFFMIRTGKQWEASTLTVFMLVQAFLTSMILGVVIPIINIKLGSSPFILLRDAMDAPIFKTNPDFVPEDGTGLNPLLQNYWMVIHPPTLFLGFAATLVPFAFCIAGLWKKQFREWVKPALPWALFATMVLGAGIVMGAYWAYETLNFGGYWSWDPVENAVYIPWVILVASYHVMLISKNETGLKTSIILVISTFILILYSTFLTRSGILGDASVHSFTDLGLSGQLLLYLFAFLVLSIVLVIYRWKSLPSDEGEISAYSREFWIFLGVTALCLMGFQVLYTTSFPVFNAVVELFGGISNLAPPTDAPVYYSKIQLWFSVAVALISGSAQFFWWRGMNKSKLLNEFFYPVVLTMVLSSVIILTAKMTSLPYILLLTSGIYIIMTNLRIMISLFKTGFNLTGGALAHVGIGFMLIGILFSSGYSKVISLNNTGLLIFRDVPDIENRENLLLWINENQTMEGYSLMYRGQYRELKDVPEYVRSRWLRATEDPNKMVADEDIILEGKTYFQKGDTVEVYAENTFYEVEYKRENGRTFTLFPRVQVNPSMGTVFSPDIRKTLTEDLYTYASAVTDPQDEAEWSETEEIEIGLGERFFLNDYVAVLEKVTPVKEVEGYFLKDEDIAVQADIRVMGEVEEYVLNPSIVIRGEYGGRIPVVLEELGVKLTFQGIKPETEKFTFAVNTTQKDYIVLKAIQKPMINLLWFGTILMTIGLGVAMNKRFKEFRRFGKKIN